AVRALRERRVEGVLEDVVRAEGPSVLVDEADSLPPGRPEERRDLEHRPERGGRCEQGRADGGARRPASEDEQPLARHPVADPLLPIARQVPTSTAPASSHATIPSGTGPTWPSAQPPRSSGCFAHRTYATIESRSAFEICDGPKRGMRYGPIRTASATCVGVA